MAAARISRTIAAPQQEVWEVVSDPHHMPRWWPGVTRMEGVDEDRFTQVFITKKGRPVRVDFRVTESEAPRRRAWEQEVIGTPFERVLAESVLELELEGEGSASPRLGDADMGEATRVTLIQRQRLRGYSRTGGFMLRRATRKRLAEALDGLQRLFG